MGMAKRACLSASLLTARGWALPDNLPARAGEGAAAPNPGEQPATSGAAVPFFLVKEAPARLRQGGGGPGGPARRAKFSLRLTAEQHARMKEAAGHLGQSCQTFMVDALNAQLERVSRRPGSEPLRLLRFEVMPPS